uniref:Uncharacterized protein n=1 Tax=Timema poppense TaxID=170557 RepID=A0A7R9CMK5_TIMPO|nr:unnamed protein product [Timema poppensis]
METCDYSLVKQEIVELIKTEPQNEDEFDMCGQSGIKSEDESDTSNSVDEIVKTEIMLYDSSFGIMDSKIDHFNPVDKSEIKLEQDQSTLSGSPTLTNFRQVRPMPLPVKWDTRTRCKHPLSWLGQIRLTEAQAKSEPQTPKENTVANLTWQTSGPRMFRLSLASTGTSAFRPERCSRPFLCSILNPITETMSSTSPAHSAFEIYSQGGGGDLGQPTHREPLRPATSRTRSSNG